MEIRAFLYVACGGALGALSRYSMSLLMPRALGGVPAATLVSNLLGCLIMGAVLQWISEAHWFSGARLAHEHYRLVFAVGFCGSFTTLSALIFEMSAMLQREDVLTAFGYLITTLLGGLVCFYAGVVIMRLLLPAAH